jgi:hypothetical protein
MDFAGVPNGQRKPRREKRPFTTEEDAKLTELVAQHGDYAWHEIERFLPGRSSRQCRERWNLYLSPTVANEPWTAEEDMLLMRLYPVIGPKWTLIAKNFPRRTANNIKNRQQQMLRKAQRMTRLAPRDPHISGFDPLATIRLGVNLQQPNGAAVMPPAPETDHTRHEMPPIP